MNDKDAKILIVDDDPFILDYLSKLLNEFGYDSAASNNSVNALELFKSHRFGIVLTDIKMPGISGIELLNMIHDVDPDTPVVLMTAYAELEIAIEALQKGAFDFVSKPFRSEYLINCIKKALRHHKALQIEKHYKSMLENTVKAKTEELAATLIEMKNLNKEIIQRLATVAEFRDTDSATHFSRISLYANKIAEAMDFDSSYVETITLASKLHDIGKIAIPDNILLKTNSLTPKEWEIMKSHTTIGGNILSGSDHQALKIASSIALHHHEKWDGSGYPFGLRGADIPFEGRLIIVCDQYDAIRSRRPYKKSFSHEETFKILTEGDGRTEPTHFDPDVLESFIKVSNVFDDIFEAHQDRFSEFIP